MSKKFFLLVVLLCLSVVACKKKKVEVDVYKTTEYGRGEKIGTVVFNNSKSGLIIRTNLHGLSIGQHGFHVHEDAACGHDGKDAGGHFDPLHTHTHLGPYENGHLGDLPVLTADEAGVSEEVLIAPKIKLRELKGRALIVHENGDNYSDTPKPLGGGGARFGCGVVAGW